MCRTAVVLVFAISIPAACGSEGSGPRIGEFWEKMGSGGGSAGNEGSAGNGGGAGNGGSATGGSAGDSSVGATGGASGSAVEPGPPQADWVKRFGGTGDDQRGSAATARPRGCEASAARRSMPRIRSRSIAKETS